MTAIGSQRTLWQTLKYLFVRDLYHEGTVFFQNIFAFKIFSIVKSKVFAFNAVVWKEPEGNLQHKGCSLCRWRTIKVVLAVKKLINVLINDVPQDWFFPRKTFLINGNYYYWWTHIFLHWARNLYAFFLRPLLEKKKLQCTQRPALILRCDSNNNPIWSPQAAKLGVWM